MYTRSVRVAANPARAYVCLSCISRGTAPSLASLGHIRHLTQDVAPSDAKGPKDGIQHVIHGSIKRKKFAVRKKKAFSSPTSASHDTAAPGLAAKKKKPPGKKGPGPPHKSQEKPGADKAQLSEFLGKVAGPVRIAPDADLPDAPGGNVSNQRRVNKYSASAKRAIKTKGIDSWQPPSMIGRLKPASTNGKGELAKDFFPKSSKSSELLFKENAPPMVRGSIPGNVESVGAKEVEVISLNTESTAVPRLAYGLDRVLFNPGVYHLQDPRSRVFNFDPYLRDIMPVTEFDFKALNAYIISSADNNLRAKAKEAGKKYIGSSSSMTGVLAHFHYLLSWWRPVDTSTMSQGFPLLLRSFTRINRKPAAVFLRYKDGVYAIDGDKELDGGTILMSLGKSMEKLLTMPSDQFERYRRSHSDPIEAESSPETYHYSTCGDFLMRAQLDAYDPRLPGTGMFDLKTRATVSIRMMPGNPKEGLGYQIKGRFGTLESFEREYFDMIRSAFLKYSLQVRIGRMDGIFVAFHNVQRIFGFQYVSLPEMDKALHGQTDTALGDAEFRLSVKLWNKVLNKITEKFPEQSVRLHFETRDNTSPFMYIFAEPMEDTEIDALQAKGQSRMEKFERELLYPEPAQEVDSEAPQNVDLDSTSSVAPSDISAAKESENVETTQQTEKTVEAVEAKKTEETGETDEVEKVMETKQEGKKEERQDVPEGMEAQKGENEEEQRPVFAMSLSIRNLMNGKPVARPTRFTSQDTWNVEYNIGTFSESRGRTLFNQCRARRVKDNDPDEPSSTNNESNPFYFQLKNVSEMGRQWEAEQDKIEEEKGIIRYED